MAGVVSLDVVTGARTIQLSTARFSRVVGRLSRCVCEGERMVNAEQGEG